MNKTMLHPNNRHRHGYDIKALCLVHPALKPFVVNTSVVNTFGDTSSVVKNKSIAKKGNKPKSIHKLTIDFSNAKAVTELNTALLKQNYQIKHWKIPQGYLCPAIPGRVDYIHYLADLLKETLNSETSDSLKNNKKRKVKLKIKVLDVGTGAGCIYPILGHIEYNWDFVASDIDPISIKTANNIIQSNKGFSKAIECRLQPDNKQIFHGIIKADDFFHLTLCNPPFHKSLAEANAGTIRKWTNLAKKDITNKQPSTGKHLNFGGQKAELWCHGGEVKFIRDMIKESKGYQKQVLWFTCLVSKKDNLSAIKLSLKKAKVVQLRVIKMAQGQKISRFIAWSFLTAEQQKLAIAN